MDPINSTEISKALQQNSLPAHFRGVYVLKLKLFGAGFGAVLLQTLNQIRYCERNGLLPVVNYDESCHSHFFDKSCGDNMWSQYFEPLVPPLDYSTILSCCQDPKHSLTVDTLQNLSDEEMLHISQHHEDSIYTFTFADWRNSPPEDLHNWYQTQRQKGRETFAKYIRVKPHITERIQAFWHQHFNNSQVLGLHIRGTDLSYAPPMSPAEYFEFVDQWLASHNNPKLFIATDQVQYLTTFQQRYGDIVVAYDSTRSTDEVVPSNLKNVSPYKKGEDVLIDMLLLSKANFLIKGASAVAELAMYINPQLKCLDLSLNQRFAFGQDYGKGWNGGSPNETKPAWLLVKDTNLCSVSEQAKAQTGLQALLYKYRPLYSPPVLFAARVFNAIKRRL